MPVAVAIPSRPQETDPLEKLANAVAIAKSIYGIHTDSKQLDQMMDDKKKQREQTDLNLKEARRKEAEAEADNQTTGPIIDSIRQQAKARGLTLPEGISVKQARTNFDAFFKPIEAKVVDPYTQEMRELRLQEMKDKKAQGTKRDQEFGKRFRNINTQIANLDKLVKDDGTAELFGDHEKKLQQTIDSIAIDSAKLFDPESVARESEVAAFRNMLFTPGDSMTADKTARGALENYRKLIRSRAENEGMAHLIQDDAGTVAGSSDQIPVDIKNQAAAILAKRRAQAKK